MKWLTLPLRRPFSPFEYRRQSAPLAFALLLLLWCIPNSKAQTFIPSTVPEFVFPAPCDTTVLPPGTGSYPNDGYMSSRFRGAAYRCLVGAGASLKELLLWGGNVGNISGHDRNIISFKLTKSLTDTGTYMRGYQEFTRYGPTPNTEMQVNFVGNGYSAYALAAYWDVTANLFALDVYKLDLNLTSITSGLTWVTTIPLSASFSTGSPAKKVSMFGFDRQNIGVIWENPNGGLSARAIYLDSVTVKTGNIFDLPSTASCRYPDICATQARGTRGSDGLVYHFAFLDTATLNIKVASMGVYDLLNFGTLTPIYPSPAQPYIIEDTFRISKYDPSWDQFQLQIVAPVFPTLTFGRFNTGNWAYTYYNNDSNKIYFRAQNSALPPTTFVVNNGSLGNGDISLASNAFPAMTYTTTNNLCLGWYTNYDPTLPAGASPLYSYTTDSKKYVAVEVKDDGTTVSDYLEVSGNYTNNNIGEGLSRGWGYYYSGYPFITFSKRTLDAMFLAYSCHGTTDIWNGYAAYYTYPRDGAFSPMYSGEANYVATKLIKPVSPPVFRLAQPETTPVALMGNPFTDNRIFQLQGDKDTVYTLNMTAMDGRTVYTASGSIPDLNGSLRFAGPINSLQPGIYILHLTAKGQAAQTFKVVKQ